MSVGGAMAGYNQQILAADTKFSRHRFPGDPLLRKTYLKRRFVYFL
jgi:hypothetical protein